MQMFAQRGHGAAQVRERRRAPVPAGSCVVFSSSPASCFVSTAACFSSCYFSASSIASALCTGQRCCPFRRERSVFSPCSCVFRVHDVQSTGCNLLPFDLREFVTEQQVSVLLSSCSRALLRACMPSASLRSLACIHHPVVCASLLLETPVALECGRLNMNFCGDVFCVKPCACVDLFRRFPS